MQHCAELVVLLAALAVTLAADPESYKGYRLVSVSVADPHRLAVVRGLATGRRDLGVDVLGMDSEQDRAALLVAPHAAEDVLLLLNTTRVPHRVQWADVQLVLDEEAARRSAEPRDVTPEGEFTDQRFMRYEEVERYLRRLAAEHPDLVALQSLGRTHEGRELTGVLVSRGAASAASTRPAILIDAGFHAREWIGPAVALYVVHQLVENEHHLHLLDGLDWYIFPLLNPDGYEYSHTNNRFWRKNRSNASDPWCRGVDLNRNFGFHWAENGASHAPCDINFAGPRAFSELETQHFRDFVLDKNKDRAIKMYLTLHSYGRLILHPWGYTDELPADVDRLRAVGEEANRAMVAAGSKRYRVGSPPSLLYPAAGGSDDWAKGEGGVEAVYCLELPGGGPNGFDIAKEKIAKTVRHVFEGVKAFAKHAREP